jgi:hypothetical protein
VNKVGPFTPDDLRELGEFFDTTDGVVSMREVYDGNRNPRVVGVRHDVDNHPKALDTAVNMAVWEEANGWSSTYFLLHTARYWKDGRWKKAAQTIAMFGHEIGLHVDAIAQSLIFGGDPHEIVSRALEELRAEGHDVVGVVGHGHRPVCIVANFANDEQFTECVRPEMGAPDRELQFKGRRLKLDPRPLAYYGLKYESIGLRQREGNHGVMQTRPGQVYNTDSGREWYYPFEQTVAEFNAITDGQLHLLIHPDHWHEAFDREAVAV